ncbi:MAG: tetratricopeptide repeat protein, partial [bacterium]
EFASLIQQVESEKELQPLYDSALKAKASGDANQARALLEQIRSKNPAYKDVAVQLAELDAKLATETKKQTYAALYEQAQNYVNEGKLELAVATYESLVQQAGVYKDARSKLQAVRQQLEEKQLNDRLESEYANGVAALKARNWARAILVFEKILEVDRSFRDARRRLAEAQYGLDRESTETVVTRYYTEGISAISQNDFGAALTAFEKVRQLNPNYRDTESLLAEVEKALRATAAPQASPLAASANIDSLYQDALTAFEKTDWAQAVVGFEKIQVLQPGYLDVNDRLAEARQHVGMAEAANPLQQGAGSKLSIYVILAALVVLPLLGFLIFSPELNAQLHLLRGNYTAAAQIYEKTLTRYPKKVKLYPLLANIYLLLGRNDESAIKVYKTVLQLNLATRHRDEISTIVAQNYLTEGRTDSDAIEVLESALKAEQRRQQRG